MQVNITNYNSENLQAIKNAWESEWAGEDQSKYNIDKDNHCLQFTAEGFLYGGEAEDEFADRLAVAIWKANKGYCKLDISAIYLEDNPRNIYSYGEDDYFSSMVKPTAEEP